MLGSSCLLVHASSFMLPRSCGRHIRMTMAVLGTGIMGAALARNFLKAGETVRVWNRTPEKAEPLADDGAHVIADVAEAVDGADVIVTMLYDGAAVEQTIKDAASGLNPGIIWLQ